MMMMMTMFMLMAVFGGVVDTQTPYIHSHYRYCRRLNTQMHTRTHTSV